jgi:hypothetical protein
VNGNEQPRSLNEAVPLVVSKDNEDFVPRAKARLFQNTKAARLVRGFFVNKDQDRVRADLATFFGSRPEIYLSIYEKMRSSGRPGFSWSWAAFFGGFVWFFYRRMYVWGASLILLPIILAVLYPSMTAFSYLYFAASAKPLYVHVALKRIGKADELGLTGTERSEYLRRAGGVSLTAGIIAGFLAAAFVAAAIYGAYFERHPGG